MNAQPWNNFELQIIIICFSVWTTLRFLSKNLTSIYDLLHKMLFVALSYGTLILGLNASVSKINQSGNSSSDLLYIFNNNLHLNTTALF